MKPPPVLESKEEIVVRSVRTPYRLTPIMPPKDRLQTHKEVERDMINNLMVEFTNKYPQLSRRQRKDLAQKQARARIQAFRERQRRQALEDSCL